MKFEIPYNFDKQLIDILSVVQQGDIYCIYMPPYPKHYQAIPRSPEQQDFLNNLSIKEYQQHIEKINNFFPNKIQIILQDTEKILNKDSIQYYRSLGINKFCTGNPRQAELIKQIDENIDILGSIVMKINLDKINNNIEYKDYFDGFILPFEFGRNLNQLKQLPKKFKYGIIANSKCSIHCNGIQHWYSNNSGYNCPLKNYNTLDERWKNTCTIRPMDTQIFEKYISIYKLQDRDWPTKIIIRDYILYSSFYDMFPGIEYGENIYD